MASSKSTRSLIPSAVADCLRQHGETFLRECHDKVTLQQRKVLSAIQRCRTGELGHVRRSPSVPFSVFRSRSSVTSQPTT